MTPDEQAGQGDSETIGVEQAREKLAAAGDVRVIDIRSHEEWLELRVPSSVNADPDNVADHLGEPDDEQEVIVVCNDGKRSSEVAGQLRSDGRKAVALEGGMSAWEDEDMPMQPSDDFKPPEDDPA